MRDSIDKGIKLFRAFNDVEPENIDKIVVPDYDVVVRIGECTHIAYLANDGKNYIHRFAKRSRPVLAVSHNGKQLLLLKGKYRFTDRGIVDLK